MQKLKEIFLGNKWICQGGRDGQPYHGPTYNKIFNKCEICGLPRPRRVKKVNRNKLLFVALFTLAFLLAIVLKFLIDLLQK